ncbi:aminoglycoside phosphotransferase family protein [Sinomonas mesophila]|uniref:aminoglycoside phosphotransferase family protein n=1 Tax=Sinomonas mesophila TaxID=1531955 RepID=UPI0009873D83|nr:aminoglycoside phosphotransferase family protein [Sinomonas mesophila]
MTSVPAASAVPSEEFPITLGLVAGLLADQHPDLARLPLRPAAVGWDNVVYRLGDGLCVRVPRRALAAELVRKELDVVPALAARLADAGVGVALPVPVREGRPGRGYPWPWSVCRWTEGTPGLEVPAAERASAVPALAAFLRALHTPAPAGAPENPFRGGGLAGLDTAVGSRLAVLSQLGAPSRHGGPGAPCPARIGAGDVPALARLWDRLRGTPELDGPRRWIHGDLHAGNVLFAPDGGLAGVIDFGDVCAGDPAADLAAAWQLFRAQDRERFRSLLEHDGSGYGEACWLRAAGWALHFGLLSVATEGNDPAFVRNGEETLAGLLAEFGLSRGAQTGSP